MAGLEGTGELLLHRVALATVRSRCADTLEVPTLLVGQQVAFLDGPGAFAPDVVVSPSLSERRRQAGDEVCGTAQASE